MSNKTSVPVIDYLPFSERDVSHEYHNALARIANSKEVRDPQFHNGTMTKYFVNEMRFPMKHGFPLITERRITEKAMRYAMAEIIGFIHGATTLNELESFGLPKFWWERWVNLSRVRDENGDYWVDLPDNDKGEHLGRFSYGGIWGKFPGQNGGEINQWENVIKQMMAKPSALTHRVTNWYPPGIIVPDGKRQVVVAPCHGDVQIELYPEKKRLTLIHAQRSADVATGVPYNMVHYAGIGMMLSLVHGYTFENYYHVMMDSHMYNEKQKDLVQELLRRESRRLPTVELRFKTTGDPVADFFAIRPEHFHLSDYDPHPAMKVYTEL